MKIIRSYEIANITLTMEERNDNYFVIVRRGGKQLANIYYHWDNQRGAENQFNLLQELIPALIRG